MTEGFKNLFAVFTGKGYKDLARQNGTAYQTVKNQIYQTTKRLGQLLGRDDEYNPLIADEVNGIIIRQFLAIEDKPCCACGECTILNSDGLCLQCWAERQYKESKQ